MELLGQHLVGSDLREQSEDLLRLRVALRDQLVRRLRDAVGLADAADGAFGAAAAVNMIRSGLIVG